MIGRVMDVPVDEQYVAEMLKRNLDEIVLEGRTLLKPADDILPSDWADKNIYLPETSVEPGRYRTDRTPHARAIMNASANPEVRQITIMGSSQIAKTSIINNIIGYFIDVEPCHIMLMQPTDNDARDYSMQKLEPMIADSPALRGKVAKSRVKDKDNSTLRKKFVGGLLSIVAGTSPRATRQRSARVTIGDDIDGLELNAKEGDPVARLIKRSTTYPDALNINASTPTKDGSSRIAALYEQSNKMKYYVPCPACGKKDWLRWENLDWEKDKDLLGKVTHHYVETVKYAWQCCGYMMNEGERHEALRKGDWIAERPGVRDHMGFWINEISSTLSSMKKVAQAIIDATDDNEKLEALYNTVLGMPWKPMAGKELDPIQLIENVDDYINLEDLKIPNGVLLITAAADVQEGNKEKPQRIEAEVWGWGKGEQGWLLWKRAYPGNLHDYEATWARLDELFATQWVRVDGVPLTAARMGVDSGDNTQVVYEFVRGRYEDGIVPVKGSNKYGAPMIPKTFSSVDRGRINLMLIGTQTIKEELFLRLERVKQQGPKFMNFAKCFANSEYFKQLTAEHKVTKYIGAMQYNVYEPKRRGMANEALDLMVYNYAMMRSLMPNWEKMEQSISNYRESHELREAPGVIREKEITQMDREENTGARRLSDRANNIRPVMRRNFVTDF